MTSNFLFLVSNPTTIACYEKAIIYIDGETSEEVPLSQIVSLIELSEYCEQSFSYACMYAPLRKEEVDLALWEDRHGIKNNYFTGEEKFEHIQFN